VISRPPGRSYLQGVRKTFWTSATQAISPERRRGKAHGAPNVHGVAENVEWEALDTMVHEDPEVIAKECARNAERPCRSDNKRLAKREEGRWN
jgi:hypothetical protein